MYINQVISKSDHIRISIKTDKLCKLNHKLNLQYPFLVNLRDQKIQEF